MLATDRDLVALCRAVDDDQPGALGQLADLLEERGDPRGAGLREAATYAPAQVIPPYFRNHPWMWSEDLPTTDGPGLDGLPAEVFSRLPTTKGLAYMAFYRTRSAAYLALAQALAGEPAP